jgi:DNA modification methylase
MFCGDSRYHNIYRTLIVRDHAQAVITDAPFNVKINGHARGKGKKHHREFTMASGEMSGLEYQRFLQEVMGCASLVSADGSLHYWFIDWRNLPPLLTAGEHNYDEWKQLLVWNKVNAGMGSFYRSQHEMIAIFKKGRKPHINNFGLGATGRSRSNVIDFPGMTTSTARNRKERDLHPTVKPVGLLAELIRDCSHRGGTILDPFAGSGSVLLAAERTGRSARAIEIDPIYTDVAINRWQEITGKKAVLATSKKHFAEVAKQRSAIRAADDT